MDSSPADYHQGDQNISEQEASYRLFGTLTKWVSLHLAVLILMLSLWFCVGVDFLSGLIPGLILLGAGIFFLRAKPADAP